MGLSEIFYLLILMYVRNLLFFGPETITGLISINSFKK